MSSGIYSNFYFKIGMILFGTCLPILIYYLLTWDGPHDQVLESILNITRNVRRQDSKCLNVL